MEAEFLVTEKQKSFMKSVEESCLVTVNEIVALVFGETKDCMECSQCIICESPVGRTDKKGSDNIIDNKNQIWYWLQPDKCFPNIFSQVK